MIFHITSAIEWDRAMLTELYTAKSLESESFIHCSTLAQITDTANIFFRGQKGLLILCIDEARLSPECKYESPTVKGQPDPGRGGLFPHVYGAINLTAIVKTVNFPPDGNGLFSLPTELKNLIAR